MYGFNSDKDNSASNAYLFLYLITGLAAAVYLFARMAESNNHLKYENRAARIIAGAILFMMYALHTKKGDMTIPDSEQLITLGPHFTAMEALAVASKRESKPTRFLATDAFDVIPGIKSFMSMFKTIPVETNPPKSNEGPTGNSKALDSASEALSQGDCVALFPQGNFSYIGEEPPRVYEGAAKLALKNKLPIHVYRQDGFWCLKIPLPTFILNNRYYRAFVCAFLPNNIHLTKCCTIDLHLQPENEQLSDAEKIKRICAELYAYYRHTRELTPKEIGSIKGEIAGGKHLLIWENKLQQGNLEKQLKETKSEQRELEKLSFETMTASLK